MSDTTIPAAACRRCGGWLSCGGMSQHTNSEVPVLGRTGCLCGHVSVLKSQIERFEGIMAELRSHGTAASMDCRQMRVCESNSSHARTKLRNIRETIKGQA